MTIEAVCRKCESKKIIKYGRTAEKKQRYLCKSCRNSFILDYTYQAYNAGTEETVVKMTANGSSLREISRVLGISTDTVMKILKKQIHS